MDPLRCLTIAQTCMAAYLFKDLPEGVMLYREMRDAIPIHSLVCEQWLRYLEDQDQGPIDREWSIPCPEERTADGVNHETSTLYYFHGMW